MSILPFEGAFVGASLLFACGQRKDQAVEMGGGVARSLWRLWCGGPAKVVRVFSGTARWSMLHDGPGHRGAAMDEVVLEVDDWLDATRWRWRLSTTRGGWLTIRWR